MIVYKGRYAELYDIIYSKKPYKSEAKFIHRCLRRFSGIQVHRLLDLACGTGTHSLLLERMGYEIVAIDNSEDMLACARAKAEKLLSKVEFRSQDMRKLGLPEQPFDAAICLFDSIGYVVTDDGLKCTLQSVHRSLLPGGLFICEFWHAPAMLRRYEPLRISRISGPTGEILRISETTLERSRQLAHVSYTIFEQASKGIFCRYAEKQTNRFFRKQEMAAWLSRSGFIGLGWYAGYRETESITEDTWHIVVVARRS